MFLTTKDIDGLKEIRSLNAAFLESGEASALVQEYLRNADLNEELLLRYLRGRKYKPTYAWETLKRHAQVRFDIYPEIFPEKPSQKVREILEDKEICGVLKSKDNLGRRICVFETSKWDPDEYSTVDLNIAYVHVMEKLLQDEDAMKNGVVIITDCSGGNRKHAKLVTPQLARRMIDIFWQSYPIKLKGIYYVNVPYLLTYVLKFIRVFLPKKLKERFVISNECVSRTEEIQHMFSPGILPEYLGGRLKFNEAVDFSFATR